MFNILLFAYTAFSTFFYAILTAVFWIKGKDWGLEGRYLFTYLNFTIFLVYLFGWYDLFVGDKKGYAHILGASVLVLIMVAEYMFIFSSQIFTLYLEKQSLLKFLQLEKKVLFIFLLSFVFSLPGIYLIKKRCSIVK
jgi:hypothetical protein